MGQVFHGSAKTTHAIRGELQRSQASVANLAKRYGINEKTVLKWRKRQTVEDLPMGPRERRSTGDCQDFRVWAGIMGKKESHYVPTQRTGDTG